MHIRIPGWLNEPVPGDLYHYESREKVVPLVKVNGKPTAYITKDGYAVISRQWKKNDIVTVDFPMEVKRVISNAAIKQNLNSVALQYGPLVYCVEGADNQGSALNLVVPQELILKHFFNLHYWVVLIPFNSKLRYSR